MPRPEADMYSAVDQGVRGGQTYADNNALALLLRQSMDEEYRVAADRERADRRQRPVRSVRWQRALTWLVSCVIGLAVVVAAVQTSQASVSQLASNGLLLERIDDNREVLGERQRTLADLSDGNDQLQRSLVSLSDRLSTVGSRRAVLAAATGYGATTGDGVDVRLSDDPRGTSSGQVRDTDLALVLNALWQSGARAISVNGQRVTALSAPRNSGEVVRLNGVSLSSPYDVLAVGDQDALAGAMSGTAAGRQVLASADDYGFTVAVAVEEGMQLPAAAQGIGTLSHATPVSEATSGRETD